MIFSQGFILCGQFVQSNERKIKMSNENFFYFTAEHNECLEVWENGTLKYSETAPFGELMFNLLKFKYPDELYYFTRKYISTWAHGETVDLFWLDRHMKELPVTYGVRNGALTEMLCSIKAEDVIYYTLCKACAFWQNQKMCTIVCQRCGRYFFNFKYGRSVRYCNHINMSGCTCRDEAKHLIAGKYKTSEELLVRELYLKIYNAQRRRWKNGELSKVQLDTWSAKGREQRNLCKKGLISLNEFTEWLDTNKDSY